jgi:hypothetical protein
VGDPSSAGYNLLRYLLAWDRDLCQALIGVSPRAVPGALAFSIVVTRP